MAIVVSREDAAGLLNYPSGKGATVVAEVTDTNRLVINGAVKW